METLPIAATDWPDVLYKAVARVHNKNTTYTTLDKIPEMNTE